MGVTLITASVCPKCDRPFRAGQFLVWTADDRLAHSECPIESVPVVTTAEPGDTRPLAGFDAQGRALVHAGWVGDAALAAVNQPVPFVPRTHVVESISDPTTIDVNDPSVEVVEHLAGSAEGVDLDAVEARRVDWMNDREMRLGDAIELICEDMPALIAEVRRLRAHLARYGCHLASCQWPDGSGCICGWSEVGGDV